MVNLSIKVRTSYVSNMLRLTPEGLYVCSNKICSRNSLHVSMDKPLIRQLAPGPDPGREISQANR